MSIFFLFFFLHSLIGLYIFYRENKKKIQIFLYHGWNLDFINDSLGRFISAWQIFVCNICIFKAVRFQKVAIKLFSHMSLRTLQMLLSTVTMNRQQSLDTYYDFLLSLYLSLFCVRSRNVSVFLKWFILHYLYY